LEKRMLVAIGLSILVVMIFTHLQQPAESPLPPENGEIVSTGSVSDTAVTEPVETGETVKSVARTPVTRNEETVELNTDTVPYETPHIKGFFDRRGARLASIQLKEYERLDNDTLLYDLAGEQSGGLVFGNSHPTPIARRNNYSLLKSEKDNVYRFQTSLKNGAKIEKIYSFDREKPYQVQLKIRLINPTSGSLAFKDIDFPIGAAGKVGGALAWGPGFGIIPEEETRFDGIYAYYGKKGDMEYLSPGGGGGITSFFSGDEDKKQFARGPLEWTSLANRFFIAAVVPHKPFNIIYLGNTDNNAPNEFVSWSGYSPFELKSGQEIDYDFDLYLGPKKYYELQEFHPGVETTLNYGWFTFLALPMLYGLNTIYSFIPNYGLAIILLSVFIKLILYPLTKKRLTSMQKMRELQPEIKKIQEKYKDDKEELNKRMMEFYQKNNLNPVGGCMPMLLQLPVFISLYRMLQYSIELRGANFMFWISDLSARDPYYILPVLMGLLMFAQQKQTMGSGGGSGAMGQQKMMAYVMPVMFVFIFMNFPVGLVLYWMTNSAATLAQYWLINRSAD